MEKTWDVLETAKKVTEKSRHVSIDRKALVEFTAKLHEDGILVPQWDNPYHLNSKGEEMVAYILALDTVNFCFWSEKEKRKWEVQYDAEELSGYYALAASLKRAVESGIPFTRADYLAEMSIEKLKEILGGKGELQLMEDRVEALKELGRVLLDEYDGTFLHLVEACAGSAVNLARLLAEKLISFRDTAEYCGFQVSFFKRAQIIVSDLFGAFGGEGFGKFKDMHKLTCFADYKLPQVLRALGILRYSPYLANKVDQQILLEAGSPEEVEIRACTIHSVELIRREFQKMGEELRAFEVDWILWNMGQYEMFREKPYHRTVTVFY